MLKQIMRYPVVRSEIRTFSFDGRTTQWEQDNVIVGRFPARVMVGLLHSNAFNGDMGRKHYTFQKFGLIQVRQTLDGEEYPYRTLELTGDQAYEDLLGYDRFLQAIDAYNEGKIPMLLPSYWGQRNNCTLHCFCLTMCPVANQMTPSIATPVNRAMCAWWLISEPPSITTSPSWCGANMKTCTRSIIWEV